MIDKRYTIEVKITCPDGRVAGCLRSVGKETAENYPNGLAPRLRFEGAMVMESAVRGVMGEEHLHEN